MADLHQPPAPPVAGASESDPSPDAPDGDLLPDAPDGDLLALYRALLVPRAVEHKMLTLLRRGQLGKWFSGMGQEAVSVGLVAALRPDDWVLPAHRNLAVFTGRGLDLGVLFRQLLGREGGFTGGRDRTFHVGIPEHHIVGMISHLGAMAPVACGLALAGRLRGEDRVAAVLVGDGATSEGDVHEAMNLAAVWKLGVVFVIENNQWGLSTPAADQYACADLVDRAPGYGMPGEIVDGNDVLAVRAAVSRAAGRARAGGGPTLLECKTFRMRGHEEASGNDYVPADQIAAWAARDPITRLEARLTARGLLSPGERDRLGAEVRAEVDGLMAEALAAPEPASTPGAELDRVYAPAAPLRRAATRPWTGAPAGGGELRYVDAVRDALATALAADDRIVLLGQDIAGYGGVFKATEGLVDTYGPERVRNTPIIESGAIGAALGLALDGFRPVVEMQFGDFVTCGFNQLVNNVATTRYRWGAPVPLVVRLPVGGGLGAGPFHSQNVESWFCHVAGLKVVAPATPADAKGLLLAALDDGNPVLVLEHKRLYRRARGPVPAGHHTEPLGRARVVRPGRHATVVTYGAGVEWALAAAEVVAGEDGKDVEVVDLRSLRPWDRETVLDSVRRTSRALVAHEAPLMGGFGAEVAAVVGQEAFAWLDAPVGRVGGLDTPIPYAPPLEATWSAEGRLLPALRDLLAF
ncbi:MAG TPA: dehydrogenase E1 component subunit alpha/beta [Acidimicrobiales bacterium]|nr:dehydrogenase E1 component subunit alpha/beta [Acidimicrobiales bacterium]